MFPSEFMSDGVYLLFIKSTLSVYVKFTIVCANGSSSYPWNNGISYSLKLGRIYISIVLLTSLIAILTLCPAPTFTNSPLSNRYAHGTFVLSHCSKIETDNV